jgi:FkbM family methyltransferase
MSKIVKWILSATIKRRVAGSALIYALSRNIVAAFENQDVHISTNGEKWLLNQLASMRPVFAFDVGANHGEWAMALASATEQFRVFCYEPVPSTFATLRDNVIDPRITHFNLALSSAPGHLSISSVVGRSDLASLHGVAHYGQGLATEVVEVTASTGDAEIRRHLIPHIDILKVDAEGHDYDVLCGFSNAITAGMIDVIQFEYNYSTLVAGHSLRDFFELLGGNYVICRLLSNGLEVNGYHPTLDTFSQSNWIALRRSFVSPATISALSVRPAAGLAGASLMAKLDEDPELSAWLGLPPSLEVGACIR